MTGAPALVTDRLRLRAPRLEDFGPYAGFYASERSRYEDGPLSREEAWKVFAASAGLWLLRGYGVWSIEERATGRYLGETGIFRFATYPEAEIGWTLVDGSEGKGIAFEAARAARAWCYRSFGWTTLVSYIDPENARSIRLAERLGASRDDAAPRPSPGDLVYRHPGPEPLS